MDYQSRSFALLTVNDKGFVYQFLGIVVILRSSKSGVEQPFIVAQIEFIEILAKRIAHDQSYSPYGEKFSSSRSSSKLSSSSSNEKATISGTSRNSMMVILNAVAMRTRVASVGDFDFSRRMLLTVEYETPLIVASLLTDSPLLLRSSLIRRATIFVKLVRATTFALWVFQF